MIDLLDLVRSIAAAAERATENKNYPVPCGPASPLLVIVRAAGQTTAATPGGLVSMSDGAEPGSGELDCPACGGSGHAGDVAPGSVP